MQPKPSHYSADYAAWFQDPLVIAAYPARPPYPEQVFELLASLVLDAPRAVLDVGCGPGDLARRLAPLVERVDAVDIAAGMLEARPALARWRREQRALDPRGRGGSVHRAAVRTGHRRESLHWMDWEVVMPRFAAALTPGGSLAIVERLWPAPEALRQALLRIIARHSPVRDYRPTNLVVELARRGLFAMTGQRTCGAVAWQPTVDEYLEARHSQRGLSRTHMGPSAVEAFDAEVRTLLDESVRAGVIGVSAGHLQLSTATLVTWGRPLKHGEKHR